MILDLETDPSQLLTLSVSTWQTAPISGLPNSVYHNPPVTRNVWAPNSSNNSSLQKSTSMTSTHRAIYVPPPLPLASTLFIKITSTGEISPYADEAMIVHPPDVPCQYHPQINPRVRDNSNSLSAYGVPSPTRRAGEEPDTGGDISASGDSNDDDEPSVLNLDTSYDTLTVDRNSKSVKGEPIDDRVSVSSFFSTLPMDPEPTSIDPSIPPVPELSFSSEEFAIPTPVARVAPAASGVQDRHPRSRPPR